MTAQLRPPVTRDAQTGELSTSVNEWATSALGRVRLASLGADEYVIVHLRRGGGAGTGDVGSQYGDPNQRGYVNIYTEIERGYFPLVTKMVGPGQPLDRTPIAPFTRLQVFSHEMGMRSDIATVSLAGPGWRGWRT